MLSTLLLVSAGCMSDFLYGTWCSEFTPMLDARILFTNTTTADRYAPQPTKTNKQLSYVLMKSSESYEITCGYNKTHCHLDYGVTIVQ